MIKQVALQPRFSCIVSKADGSNPLEITKDINSITLSIDQNFISILEFELDKPEKYMGWIDNSYRINFYGGYLVGNDYYNELPNNEF